MSNNHFTLKSQIRFLYVVVIVLVSLAVECLAQTTGKISGRVTDAKAGEPIPAVSIVIEGTSMGAATDINGEYFIINIPLGTYRLRATMVGYEAVVMKDVVVSVSRTTTADFKLKEGVIEGQEVLITADRIQQKRDQTSSVRNVTSDQMNALPVENIDQVVNLQAGVVRGHFRGGRDKEVAYLVDGVSVQESYDLNRAVTVENDVVSEVEVITGTFNAEYGNAMSGIVNSITKDGGNTIKGSASVNGSNYFTSHTDIFPHLGVSNLEDLPRGKDYKLFLEGPIVKDLLTFVVNGRYQEYAGPRDGIRRFMPDNYSNWDSQDSTQWISNHTGDNAIVPLGTGKNMSFFGKLAFKPWQTVRAAIDYSYNYYKGKGYNHFYKFNPEGLASSNSISDLVTISLNHALSRSFFYEFRGSYVKNWSGYYVFENPLEQAKNSDGTDKFFTMKDSTGADIFRIPVYQYVHDNYGLQGTANPGFSTGGQDKSWSKNWSEDYNLKFDATWQLDKHHTLKTGITITEHNIHRFNTTIQNFYRGTPYENAGFMDSTGKVTYIYYQPEIVTGRSTYTDIYKVQPWEFAVYLQDKMEFDNMVINFGLRYDYFDPSITYPSEPRNPGNDIINSPQSEYLNAPASSQLSPRLGISYKLGDAALLRFSYGHFFQMPALYALYSDHEHLVGGDYVTVMGNPLVRPQRTVQYEAGLWQQLGSEMSLEVAVFYRDIFDLLSTKTITTFNAVHYALYSNKDYGNSRGLELKYDYYSGDFSAGINYTLQYTRGSANNPTYTFTREGNRQDPVNILIPMDWDQRHTLNASFSYNTESGGGSITGRYDSGTPYGWAPLSESDQARVNLQPNNSPQPAIISFDLNAFINLWSQGTSRVRLTLLVYNLFDRLNEYGVNATTGRANQQIIRETDLASYRSNFSTIYDRINNPSSFGDPRSIKAGIEFMY
jgi:outer membrane receptor protein involved in Fe transport